MLDFAPDRLTQTGSASCRPAWAVAWEEGGLPREAFLTGLIAASRRLPLSSGHEPGAACFKPERMSGFCAS